MPKCSTSDLFLPCGWCFSGCEALPAPLIAVGALPLGPHRHCCVEALWFLISPPRQPVCWTVTSPPGPHCVDDFCWHLTGLQVGSRTGRRKLVGVQPGGNSLLLPLLRPLCPAVYSWSMLKRNYLNSPALCQGLREIPFSDVHCS